MDVAVDRDDLAQEAPGVGGGRRLAVRREGERVELGALEPPVADHPLGAETLPDDVVQLEEPRGERRPVLLLHARPRVERNVAHVLDARADDDVVDTARDLGGREPDRLLRAAALQIDGLRRGLVGEALLQPRVAGDVHRLLTELLQAPGDHVLHERGRDPRAVEDGAERGSEQLARVPVLEHALLGVAATDGGPGGFDDDDLATSVHDAPLLTF